MKNEKEQPHHLTSEAAEPIHIHNEHADETLLAGWLRKGLEQGASFWASLIGLTALGIALVWGINSVLTKPPAGSEAWDELIVPSVVNVPSDDPRYEGMPASVRPLLKIADDHSNTAATPWALLRAAAELHAQGMRDLPNRKETGRPMLQQAIELYDRVLKAATAGSPEALDATLGKARAQESRGDLKEAIETYNLVVSKFPNTPEAKAAEQRAKDLEDPEVIAFYTDLYAKDFSTFSGSPGGMPGGMMPFGASGGRTMEDVLKSLPTGLTDGPSGSTPVRSTGELPANLLAPTAPAGATGTAPEPATPKVDGQPEGAAIVEPAAAPVIPAVQPDQAAPVTVPAPAEPTTAAP